MKIKLEDNNENLDINEENIKKNIEIIKYSKNMNDENGVNQFEEELSKNYDFKTNLEKQNIVLKNEIKKENERLNEKIKDKNITDLYSMVVNLNEVKLNLKSSDMNSLKKKYPRRTKSDNYKFLKREYSTFSNYRCNLDTDDLKLRKDLPLSLMVDNKGSDYSKVVLSDKKKTSSLLSFFIEDCKQIIDNAIDLDEEGKRESQLQLEEE